MLLAMLLALLLGGPTPGAVGSCGEIDHPADLFTYCRAREELTCWRRGLRGELSQKAVNDCRVKAIQECALRTWPPDCRPTQRQADACINALKSLDTVQTPEDRIEECSTKALCTKKAGAVEAAAADAGAEP